MFGAPRAVRRIVEALIASTILLRPARPTRLTVSHSPPTSAITGATPFSSRHSTADITGTPGSR
jgi:hypothetical protein